MSTHVVQRLVFVLGARICFSVKDSVRVNVRVRGTDMV